jgi:hypothetical protein
MVIGNRPACGAGLTDRSYADLALIKEGLGEN